MTDTITKRRVDAAKPGETIWDRKLSGYGLRVSKGGTKSYCLKFRSGAVQRWLTIGRHGPFTPETARKEAQRLLAEISLGNDPVATRQQAAKSETVGQFAERYMREHAIPTKKPRSVEEDHRNLRLHIFPFIGKMKIGEVKREHIAKIINKMSDRPYGANRVLALLSHMFTKAEAWGVRPDYSNPCRHIKKFKESKRERFLNQDELIRLGEALIEAESEGESPYVIVAVRLLLLTGARLSEILTLKWTDVDIEARLIRLSDSKTGKKTIVVPAPALDLLSALPKMKNNPYVICGMKDGTHLVNLQRPWRRIRARAGLKDVRLHDLRHSFASFAVASGMSLPLIGSLLGHSQPQTTARYAHLADDPRHAAAAAVAENIAASMAGK